ncbi:MAG: glycosyltransferase [Pseudomonadota bacterium]
MTVQVLGFCRFSFFGPSDTKLSYDDRDAAFASLYAPDRMETRFLLFENLLLPSVRAQRDTRFTLYVLTSSCMPDRYKRRLRALCQPVPQIKVIFADTLDLTEVVNPIIGDPALDTTGLVQFRIDDDDAISQRYVEKLHFWSQHMKGRIFVTMPKGIMACDHDGDALLHPMNRRMTAVGLALSSGRRSRRSILTIPHVLAGHRAPSMTDPGICAYIQTFTHTTDTARYGHRKLRKFQDATGFSVGSDAAAQQVAQYMEQDFPFFTQDHVRDIFAEANARVTERLRLAS